MTWQAVVDAWVSELTTNVSGLQSIPTSCQHKYAPWSVENLNALSGERHLAVWPESEPEVADGYLSDGSLLAVQNYVVLVWEDASAESSRRYDDDTANLAWLTLHEAIRARFLLRANVRLGDANIVDTVYLGCAFDMPGPVRSMAIRFRVRIPLTLS